MIAYIFQNVKYFNWFLPRDSKSSGRVFGARVPIVNINIPSSHYSNYLLSENSVGTDPNSYVMQEIQKDK